MKSMEIYLKLDFELYEELQRHINSNKQEDWQDALQDLLWKALEENATTDK